MDLKPLLAAKIKTDEDFAGIKFPALVSPKLDGIRSIVQRSTCLSRSLKELPNKNLHAVFSNPLLQGFDGEFIEGDPTAEDAFSRTTSVVMSSDKDVSNLKYYVFDALSHPLLGFYDRLLAVEKAVAHLNREWPSIPVCFVRHEIIHNMDELLAYETQELAKGYEGIMGRSLQGHYKHGRSTLKDGLLWAIKRFTDAEAVIVDTFEQEENTNEKTVNELGRSKRSSAQAGKIGKGTLGGFTVLAESVDARDTFGTHSFNVGTGVGLTQELRQQLWDQRGSLPGKVIKFKYQAIGVKDKPRLPIYLGFRDRMDM